MSTFVAIADLCNGVATFFAGTPGIVRVQAFGDLTEGMNDWPTLQVYPEEFEYDVTTGNDRTTFKRGVVQTEHVLSLDLYGKQRANLGEDMAAMVAAVDAIRLRLDSITTAPYFGLTTIKAYRVGRARRVTFEYGDPLHRYLGYRIPLTIRTF